MTWGARMKSSASARRLGYIRWKEPKEAVGHPATIEGVHLFSRLKSRLNLCYSSRGDTRLLVMKRSIFSASRSSLWLSRNMIRPILSRDLAATNDIGEHRSSDLLRGLHEVRSSEQLPMSNFFGSSADAKGAALRGRGIDPDAAAGPVVDRGLHAAEIGFSGVQLARDLDHRAGVAHGAGPADRRLRILGQEADQPSTSRLEVHQDAHPDVIGARKTTCSGRPFRHQADVAVFVSRKAVSVFSSSRSLDRSVGGSVCVADYAFWGSSIYLRFSRRILHLVKVAVERK